MDRTEGREGAPCAYFLRTPQRPVSLSAVFNHGNVELPRQLHDGGHVAGLAVEVDRDDGFDGEGLEAAAQRVWVHVETVRVYFNEVRERAGGGDGGHGGADRVGHLVPGPDTQGAQ